ncbi:MAG TPA: cbb3-type cytochrome c oxidase N-terminal domain-containing protein [Planctomycetaceae bacterium]|nr:cbb3-type cytochrome c oxidase N-terminal domain-containing protein [Planctomycetaceae bacterium]
MSNTPEELTNHSYDGIQEYDNPLPGWWVWLFVGSIAFCPFYWAYFHAGIPGRSIHDQYNDAVAQNLRQQFAELGELQPDRATLLKYLDDKRWLAVGESVFKTNCVSCHGPSAEGKVGPNLCDDSWKNVKTIEDVAKVIAQGAGGRAMPAWGQRLHPNELVLVACYVASLRGSNPSNAKAPEPEAKVIPPWRG